MVWLGLDLGNARIGTALSDPQLTFAHPAGNITVRGNYGVEFDEVLAIIEDEQVDHVVVGLPLQLDGTEGASARKARTWVRELIHRLVQEVADPRSGITTMPSVTLCDERLTTVDAHRRLHDAQVQGRNHRAMVDQQSAVEILQSALDQAGSDHQQA
ncbi:Holliday junction resolvase RuvX [Bifidobacterium gallicum]|uniref:Putative pre-16S rRNA nuclease n=1 Tax=Bifidobacterium gallicum DSM 20093 = LMG 11596 TaxID=561180 RepID=D1NSA9_9BIFI|nr:Holliday junction resolvase RuvX [Bifidobacterium gallicum]EFA23561.1 RNAse H domain protein, YqgF family [Bifidobacterium gallicum DSM 20093 = LMG 11596]KFI58634.1 Holliday junction resolvase [Bifidobacterium gallicum DSM 20093 = LMG 11596]